MSSPDPGIPPTRARFVVGAWLCGLAGILYLDRICMGQAVVPIQRELDLSNSQMSLVLMSFTLAYGLFAVPAGWWGDRRGPRAVLAQIVFAWSAFTALTGAATGLVTLVLVRFLFGAAEAGAFPNAAKVMTRWFPPGERGRVQGVMLAFAQLGAVAAPAATAYLIDAAGWRWVFLVYGLLGAAWAAGFWLWFRDDPAAHRGVNPAELAAIRAGAVAESGRVEVSPPPGSLREPTSPTGGEVRKEAAPLLTSPLVGEVAAERSAAAGGGGDRPTPPETITAAEPPPDDPGPVPWRRVFANRGILTLSAIMVFGAFYTYFFYSWFQKYLHAARGVGNVEAGNLTSLVMAGSAVGMLVGGWLADRIPGWAADPVTARRRLGVVCYLVAAGCLFLGVRCDDPLSLAALWGASFCAMHVTLPNWWSCAIPQAGRHTATLFGLMNGLGVLGAMASQGFVGLFADWQAARGLTGREAWDPIFHVYVGVLLANAAAWWLYRFTPLEPDS